VKLSDYIQGKRHGKEANQLEREAMNDPFLQDAIDGYDSIDGNHLETIEKLNRQIQHKLNKKPAKHRLLIVSIAASLTLLIGIGSFMHFGKSPTSEYAKTVRPVEKKVLNEDYSKKEQHKNVSRSTLNKLKLILAINRKNKKEQLKLDTVRSFTNQEVLNPSSGRNDKEISNASVYIDKKDSQEIIIRNPLLAATSKTRNKTSGKVNGQIIDEKGDPLIGVTIRLKGTNIGVITDMKGEFEISIPKEKEKNGQLITSYIGYNNREISVNSNSNIIKMEPNNLALNEVVVVGYGTQKRRDLTGSVSSIAINAPFGENEFIKYYQSHRKKELCNVQRVLLKAKFYIDNSGKPVQLKMVQSPCPEMEQEFIELLENSPKWTKTKRTVRITIRL